MVSEESDTEIRCAAVALIFQGDLNYQTLYFITGLIMPELLHSGFMCIWINSQLL